MSNLKANIFVAVIASVTEASDQLGFTIQTILKMVTTDVSPEQSFVPGSNFNTLLQIEKNKIYRIFSFIDTNNANFYDSVEDAINSGGNNIELEDGSNLNSEQ